MIYSTRITTTAGKSKTTHTRTPLKINKGLIWLLEVDFPPGCVGLVHVMIYDGKYQLLPASPGITLAGNAQLLRYEDLYLKESAPYELSIITWNEDDLYDHTIQVRIGMASTRLYMARYLPAIGWEDFTKKLDKARAIEEKLKKKQTREILKLLGEA